MKKIIFYSLIITVSFLACDEIPPVIDPQADVETDVCDQSVDVSDQQRNVLLEEFTGVRCVNCPAGSEVLETLIATHGERVSAISIHAGDFAPPYQESLYDFRNADATGLFNLIGPPIAYPASVINRVTHNGSSFLPVLSGNAWPSLVDNELEKDLILKLGIAKALDLETRTLEMCTKIIPEQDVDEDDVRITVILTESGVKDYQKTPEGKQSDYEHKHIMRDAVTPFDGLIIGEPLVAGIEVTNTFAVTIPEEWNIEKTRYIAFVSYGGIDKEVLQVVNGLVLD